MPRILITGVSGFTGRHLAAALRAAGERDVVGSGTAAVTTAAVDRYLPCDLTDAALVPRVIENLRPDVVYHLAGRTACTTPERLREVNVEGFALLCDALRGMAERRGRPVRLFTVGSAAELGAAGVARLPVDEDAPCEPETIYGRSKLEATERVLCEPVGGPLEIVAARTFNLVGPGMGPHLSLGRFARQIAAYARRETDGVRCGNLNGRRDFVDVRDAAAAYVEICRRGRPGRLYNVCSGRSYRIGDLLARLIAASGLDVPVIHEADAHRPGDVADVYGDPARTLVELGWRATTPIDRSLTDLLTWVLREPAARAA